jgi:hypothetical protein
MVGLPTAQKNNGFSHDSDNHRSRARSKKEHGELEEQNGFKRRRRDIIIAGTNKTKSKRRRRDIVFRKTMSSLRDFTRNDSPFSYNSVIPSGLERFRIDWFRIGRFRIGRDGIQAAPTELYRIDGKCFLQTARPSWA